MCAGCSAANHSGRVFSSCRKKRDRRHSCCRNRPPVVLKHSFRLNKPETVQDLAELIRQQNARLDEVLNQITVLAVRQDTKMNEAEQNPKKKTVLDSMMNNNDRVTVDLLMEMIKEQNQRLNEVIAQLKSLALNQNSALPQRFGSSLSVPMRVTHKEPPALTL